MYLGELIAELQKMMNENGDIPVEFALHSYTQTYPTVYLRNTPRIQHAHDNVVRLELYTGPDVRISILNKKTIAFVRD